MLLVVLALIAAQDAPGTVNQPRQAADGKQSWSILNDPCTSGPPRKQNEILVCGQGADSVPRLPLPDERGPPDRPMPSNPDVTGIGALNASIAPCATRSEGCTTGINIFGMGTALIRGIGKIVDPNSCCEEPGESTNPVKLVGDAIGGVGRVFRKKPDKSGRVAIDLDNLPPPEPAGLRDLDIQLPLP
ncbi:hypothetical protein [Sphingomonas sp. NIBR02145]|uniref:hypothetical protein n=1 Tax=Sphingomonas sp. NIBR02145 TaxID=3014784 RepID=UPI0022B4F469|nr:hypothetical protein [Sphingomonas sp. NIBR02145]WHU01158.1 hypothetical protein O3305_13160 [Sphingomonas sp. NIBR02145]